MKESRRNFIKNVGLASVAMVGTRAMAQTCGVATPEQDEGPFYPEQDQKDKDTNLIQVEGKKQEALGEKITLSGVVIDVDTCDPLDGALVEIWQACESGRYNHSRDPNTKAKLDPNFQYWGRAETDADGKFKFYTIRPGQYPATPDWIRPAHIHFKVQKRGFWELTSQIYFADDSLNEKDRIYMSMSEVERDSVTADFVDSTEDKGFKAGEVEIKLQAIK